MPEELKEKSIDDYKDELADKDITINALKAEKNVLEIIVERLKKKKVEMAVKRVKRRNKPTTFVRATLTQGGVR